MGKGNESWRRVREKTDLYRRRPRRRGTVVRVGRWEGGAGGGGAKRRNPPPPRESICGKERVEVMEVRGLRSGVWGRMNGGERRLSRRNPRKNSLRGERSSRQSERRMA